MSFLTKDIAIFIVNYNGIKSLGDLLFKHLDSFVNEARKYDFIDLWFVDNGSVDGSLDAVRARYKGKLRYLRLSRNLGYGGACKVAYIYTKRLGLRYKYYVCSNNDIEIYPGSLSLILRWLRTLEKKYPQGFIATSLFLNGYDNFLDTSGFFIDETGNTWPLRLALLNKDKVTNLIKLPLLVSFVDGAFLITPWNVIEKTGWFNPYLFLYYEDTEFSLRAWNYGYPSVLIPVVLGIHYRSITSRNLDILLFYLNIRNRVFSVFRYMRPQSILKLMLWYLTYPFRIAEVRRDLNLRSVITKITPGHIVYDQNDKTLRLLPKYLTRAFIEGAIMALKNRKKSMRILYNIPFINLSFTDLFNQKRVIMKLQMSVQDYILNTLAKQHETEGRQEKRHEG